MFTETWASQNHTPGPRQPALLMPRLSTQHFVPAVKSTPGGPQPNARSPDSSLSETKDKKRADSVWQGPPFNVTSWEIHIFLSKKVMRDEKRPTELHPRRKHAPPTPLTVLTYRRHRSQKQSELKSRRRFSYPGNTHLQDSKYFLGRLLIGTTELSLAVLN